MVDRPRLEKMLHAVETAAALEAQLGEGEELRESWRQAHWAIRSECGTGMCAAGWTCHLEGDAFIWDERQNGYDSAYYVRTRQGQTVEIEDRARALLGLDYADAEDLFAADNGLVRLRELVAELLAREETA